MKNVIFALALAMFTMTANAQLCSNCPNGQATPQSQPSVFTPAIFTPVPVGSYGEGTAYLKMVPVNHTRFLTAYVYMIDATGKIVEIPIAMDMSMNPPSYWPGRFEHNYVQDKQSPNTYWYRTPEPVSFRIEIKPAGSDMNGQAILGADGKPYAIQRVTYLY